MKSFQEFQEMASMVKQLTKQPTTRTVNPSDSRPNIMNRTNADAQRRQQSTKRASQREAHRKTTTNRERTSGPSTTYREVYDPEIQGRSQIKQTGEGGRKEPKRSADDRRRPGQKPRMKAVGGGKMAPVSSYKDRKDIGTTKARSEREQQPTKERGSAALSAREQQRKAYQERKARESGGKRAPITAKSKEKAASELLKKKKETPKSEGPKKERKTYQHTDGGGMTRKERDSARNKKTQADKKSAKSSMRDEFIKKHGRKPNKKEAIQMTAKAKAAARALK
tara:strand:- start:332 stop:1174 length:843 start_codon:yes stop_codon:yes gene_type:complete